MSGCYVCRKISITEDDYLDWYNEYFCADGEDAAFTYDGGGETLWIEFNRSKNYELSQE